MASTRRTFQCRRAGLAVRERGYHLHSAAVALRGLQVGHVVRSILTRRGEDAVTGLEGCSQRVEGLLPGHGGVFDHGDLGRGGGVDELGTRGVDGSVATGGSVAAAGSRGRGVAANQRLELQVLDLRVQLRAIDES